MIERRSLINNECDVAPNNPSSRHLASICRSTRKLQLRIRSGQTSLMLHSSHRRRKRYNERSRGAIEYAINPYLSLVHSIFPSAARAVIADLVVRARILERFIARVFTSEAPVFSLTHTRIRVCRSAWTRVYARPCRHCALTTHVWTRGARTSTYSCTLLRFSSGGTYICICIHIYEQRRGWISCGHAYNSRNDGSRVEIAEVRGYERGWHPAVWRGTSTPALRRGWSDDWWRLVATRSLDLSDPQPLEIREQNSVREFVSRWRYKRRVVYCKCRYLSYFSSIFIGVITIN